jgi:hypothetical protein
VQHAKNHRLFISHNRKIIVDQVINEVVKKKGGKILQFAIVLSLLQQGHPMLEYEAIKGHCVRS